MILFLVFFILVCLLIAALLIILFPKIDRRKQIFIDEGMTFDKPWSLVEKGPDSTFIEETAKEDKRD